MSYSLWSLGVSVSSLNLSRERKRIEPGNKNVIHLLCFKAKKYVLLIIKYFKSLQNFSQMLKEWAVLDL